MDFDTALAKLQRYCAYQERCAHDVRKKAAGWQLGIQTTERLLQLLCEEGFVDEERFAALYVRDKFRLKKWGRVKIRSYLRQRQIAENRIEAALENEIDGGQYRLAIRELLERKNALLREPDAAKRAQKLAAYLLQKGYESGLVWEEIKNMGNTTE